MKNTLISKKLTLNKVTVSNLMHSQLYRIKGGVTVVNCTVVNCYSVHVQCLETLEMSCIYNTCLYGCAPGGGGGASVDHCVKVECP